MPLKRLTARSKKSEKWLCKEVIKLKTYILKFMLEDNGKKIVDLANHLGESEVKDIPLAACM